MPCTIEVGNLVTQTAYNGRVWRIASENTDATSTTRRWTIVTHQTGVPDQRRVGETAHTSEAWLQDHCTDYTPARIDPPCGDGPQTVRALCDGDYVADSLFDTSVEMIAFVNDYLTPDGLNELSIEWFGWDATDQEGQADMTAVMVDGEVRWSE